MTEWNDNLEELRPDMEWVEGRRPDGTTCTVMRSPKNFNLYEVTDTKDGFKVFPAGPVEAWRARAKEPQPVKWRGRAYANS